MTAETTVFISRSDERPRGLTRIYLCQNAFTRMQGVFFRKHFNLQHGVLLRGCSAVHGIGLKRTLDVVFLDKQDRVLSLKSLKPFSMCIDNRAFSVLELCEGGIGNLNIEVGSRIEFGSLLLNPKKKSNTRGFLTQNQKGASMVEFIIVAPILIFLGMGIIQMGLVYHARNILDYATFEAARSGAVTQASNQEMKKELAYRLGPIFSGDGSSDGVRSAVGRAVAAVNNPLRTQLRIINPTAAAFYDFGVRDPETGETVLPNAHLQHRSTSVGATSGVTIQDANLLKIEVTHGYELKFPWFDMSLPGVDFVLKELMVLADPSNASFYLQGQIPLRAVATVRMQSRAIANHVNVEDPAPSRPSIAELELGEAQHPTAGLMDQQGQEEQSQSENAECTGEHGLPSNLVIESISPVDTAAQCSVPLDNTVVNSPDNQTTTASASDVLSQC